MKNLLPRIKPEEKEWIRDMLDGIPRATGYRKWILKEDEDGDRMEAPNVQDRLNRHLEKHHMKAWGEFLSRASAEEIIEQFYLEQIAYGNDTGEQMKAAKAWLDSRISGEEVGDIFIRRLKDMGAKIKVPCARGSHVFELP